MRGLCNLNLPTYRQGGSDEFGLPGFLLGDLTSFQVWVQWNSSEINPDSPGKQIVRTREGSD